MLETYFWKCWQESGNSVIFENWQFDIYNIDIKKGCHVFVSLVLLKLYSIQEIIDKAALIIHESSSFWNKMFLDENKINAEKLQK